jgi:hypothetical protein
MQRADQDPGEAFQLRARHGGVPRPLRARPRRRQLYLLVRAQGDRCAEAVNRGPQGTRVRREDRIQVRRVHREHADGVVRDAERL